MCALLFRTDQNRAAKVRKMYNCLLTACREQHIPEDRGIVLGRHGKLLNCRLHQLLQLGQHVLNRKFVNFHSLKVLSSAMDQAEISSFDRSFLRTIRVPHPVRVI
jgi:hypothetical protein